ncbi:SNF2 family DNA repair and recombination [Lecanosticta acicola]|uniref:SNF2 family DNA repair and recombination, partial n=1 Tax=Lecanosticta acicola TaxID=111012 RepID=A0AAI9E7P2_9PEZI|nr:SNF2 family DNA repair and recombination [Lecanosticta acicola]
MASPQGDGDVVPPSVLSGQDKAPVAGPSEEPAEYAQNSDSIPDDNTIEGDEEAQLAALAAGVRDQDDLERDIGRQADQLLQEQADERDKKRLEKTRKERERLQAGIDVLDKKLSEFGNKPTKDKYRSEIAHYEALIAPLDKDLEQIQKRIDDRKKEQRTSDGATEDNAGNKRMPGESQREFLIRTGKITPFSKKGKQLLKTSSSLGDILLDAEEEEEGEGEDEDVSLQEEIRAEPISHRNLLAPGFEQDESAATSAAGETEDDAALARRLQDEEFASERPAKRRRLQNRRQAKAASPEASAPGDDSDAYVPDRALHDLDDQEAEDELPFETTPGIKRKRGKKQEAVHDADDDQEDLAGIDDGNEHVYEVRLQSWVKRRSAARRRVKEQRAASQAEEGDPGYVNLEDAADPALEQAEEVKEEWHMPHPSRTDALFEGGLRIPGDIYPSLFDYQKTGVQWLWELYSQQVGGIIGDEMGLGKTIQVISFLAGLHYSGKLSKPVIVVCPATVMKQWVNEFHRWWPALRVSILHTSGSGMLDVRREARIEDDLEDDDFAGKPTQSKGHKSAKRIVDKVLRDGHVLVTTYSGLQTYADLLIPIDWEYAVLDEGHKIRNPNTAITIYCKELRTHNRVILSGTPMQNNLTELWSLFDFVFPMRLGTLINFKSQFEIPIKQGGYANASNLQVETAMKCAETLKDTISPYLLQRFKADVAADLPKKSERVLFCKLTKLQRDAYQWFLNSEEMKSIMAGKRQALYGVDILRKICNHPDLAEHKTLSKKTNYDYGHGAKSGKMQVVKALLEIWKRGSHKTLLFAQHRIMLDILEKFVQAMPGFSYRRMDGNTSIRDRQDLVDEFNKDPNLHVFLLTTKVGGLGVNLTGADRVIIYDPDWNPSTDIQARERAWRLGQKREVQIYRLMTAGTIEEKIYHRQIFKQFLTNKILRDPKQRQTFQLRDLHDLFTLGDPMQSGETETGSIFKGTEVKLSGAKGKQDRGLPTRPEENEKDRDGAEINDVAGVSRQEDFRGEDNEEKPGNDENRDDRVLSSIFSRTGVQAAQDHDAIINGRKTVRADPEMINREAKRVAAEAAKELQRAGEIARSLPAGSVTWTGQHGSAGRDPSPPRRGGMGLRGGRGGASGRGGPSSSSVLSNLSSRNLNATGAAASSPSSSRASTPAGRGGRIARAENQPKGKDFIRLIRDYLIAQQGSAYTQMLIDHFNRFCGTPERTAEFKEMLKQIAVLEKGGRGRGKWVLREEYR